MSKFGMYVKFTAQPGKRDALVEILLNAAKSMENVDDCEIYVVNVSEIDSETIWVTEVWSSKEAHQKSLTFEGAKEMIAQAKPLITAIEAINIMPLGGKGIENML